MDRMKLRETDDVVLMLNSDLLFSGIKPLQISVSVFLV